MGFLAPLFLAATALVAVPIILHLFHRQESQRISFPAIRYLLRTEKDHAKRIRLRQLILLLLRVIVILLAVGAGARLFVHGQGGEHEPTALAIVLDNSLSSGLVQGESRVLDELKALALESIALAGPDDRIWVIRAGEPWSVATPGTAAQAAAVVESTEVSASAGNLVETLVRAAELVTGAGLPASEVHLLSDLQETAFPEGVVDGSMESVSLVVYSAIEPPPPNHYLTESLVGGGLPPVANQRTDFSVQVKSSVPELVDTVGVRLVLDGGIRGAASIVTGAAALISAGPFPEGLVTGYLEVDRDGLLADDRRPFAFYVRPPPRVSLLGGESFFLASALEVLGEEERVRRTGPEVAEVIFGIGGMGLDSFAPALGTVVIPDADPTLIPALNRRLRDAGIPWQYVTAPPGGTLQVRENRTSARLTELAVSERFFIRPQGNGGPLGDVQVRLEDGEPWLVTGVGLGGPYLLLGSPLEEGAVSLPVTAEMVPFVEWAVSQWSSPVRGGRAIEAGFPISLPPEATAVVTPSEETVPVDGTRVHRATGEIGFYSVLSGDSTIASVPVVAPERESLLARITSRRLEELLGSSFTEVRRAGSWTGEVFRVRRGPELWKPFLIALLALLLIESWIAASGSHATTSTRRRETGPTAADAGSAIG